MIATFKLYGQVAAKALPRAVRGWPAALPFLVYPYVIMQASMLAAPLGMLGGFIVGLIVALLASSYLHLLSDAVAGVKIKIEDLGRSFTTHLGAILTVGFVFWIASMLVGALTHGMAENQRLLVLLVIGTVTAVFFNPLPEVIYQRHVAGQFAHLAEAARFITEHWPAWLFPNIVLGAIVLAPTGFLHAPAGARLIQLQLLFSIGGPGAILASVPLWMVPIMLLFLHFAMVFRGLLFQELSSGISSRQRAIRDAWRR